MMFKLRRKIKGIFGDRIYPHIKRAIKQLQAVKKAHISNLVRIEENIKILQDRRKITKGCIKDYEKILTKLKEQLEND